MHTKFTHSSKQVGFEPAISDFGDRRTNFLPSWEGKTLGAPQSLDTCGSNARVLGQVLTLARRDFQIQPETGESNPRTSFRPGWDSNL